MASAPSCLAISHQPLGDDGPGKGGAQQIVLVLGPHHHGGDDDLVHHLVGQVLDVQLGRTGLDGLLLQAVQLGPPVPTSAGDGDDLGVVVVLLQPGDDNGRIQTAGVGQDDFLDLSMLMTSCGAARPGRPADVFPV